VRQVVWLVALALILRLAAGVAWQARLADGGFFFGDSQGYWVLGRAVAAGGPYEMGPGGPKVFRAPGYPAVLAPLFWLFGRQPPILAARAESALLGSLGVALVWMLGRRLFGGRAGLWAGLLAAVYPGLVVLGALVLSEAPFCALLPANLLLWTAAWQATSRRRTIALALLTGLVAAATTLVRPSWLLFVPLGVGLGVAFGRPRGRHLAVGGCVLLGLVAGMLPWWVRNARVTGHFVPTTLQVGASLYDGLHPGATGASNMAYVPEFVAAERRAEAQGRADLDEPFEWRLDRRMKRAALDWARDHPGRVIELAAVKFLRTWNLWPNEPALARWGVPVVVLAGYVPILALALIGIFTSSRRGWPYVLCWLPAAYLSSLHMVFVGSLRYRQPAMLGLIVLAAGVLASAGRRWRSRCDSL